ncbi:MAG: hypothetical protein JWO46_3071 [Nocardioidaceae bacterium]|nr:hypothetical protein [Nocardioidaceae bacterium]
MLLGLRGQGQSTSGHQGVGAQVQGIVRATVRQLDDGSTVRLEGVPYPSGANATYDADVASGVRMVRHRIDVLAGACPSSRIGLVGYSQGAQAVHLAAVHGVFSLVAMVGDPLRDPQDPLTTYSFGTHLSGRGNAGPGPGFPIGQRRGVVEVCVKGDNVCDAPLTGRVGPVSATHRDFYGRPASASAAGSRLAQVVAVGPRP